MKTISCKRRIAFYVSYAAMASGCIFFGCLFAEYRLLVFLAWYFITAAIWIMLMIGVITLSKNKEITQWRGKRVMDYMCMVLGILFMAGDIIFAFGKIYKYVSAWQKMSDEEKSKIKIKPLCQNIGGMIVLNGITFVLKGCCTGFSDQIFSVAIII